MDKAKEMYDRLLDFIESFFVKYQYENRGLLKKFKIDSRLNLEIDDEKWFELFLYKSCFNHCAKFILLRYMEDNYLTNKKLNVRGIEKWNDFVTNISSDFETLYEVALRDFKAEPDEKIREIFKDSDYDVFGIDNELASILIKNFSDIQFDLVNRSDLVQLFRLIYPLEQREEMQLEYFYKEAPALSYILTLEKNTL